MFKRILLLISFIFLSRIVFAEPTISSVSEIRDGGIVKQITLVGSNFGNKATAAPFKVDDFENGIAGERVGGSNGWLRYDTGQILEQQYTNVNTRTGALAIFRQTGGGNKGFQTVGMKGLNSNEVYYSVWFYWKKVAGSYSSGSPIMKVVRINSSPAGDFYKGNTSSPSFYMTMQPMSLALYSGTVNSSGTFTDQQSSKLLNGGRQVYPEEGKWSRVEVYMRLSEPAGANNGEVKAWIDGVLVYDHISGITRTVNDTGIVIDNFLLPAMNDRAEGQTLHYYVDDVYVDKTESRVELCDMPNWSDCRKKEVQVPRAWSDTSVTFDFKVGGLSYSEKLYLYVINAEGDANSLGHLLATTPAQANLLVK